MICRSNSSSFEAVKAAVTTQQAAQAYGLEPNRKGFCRCPFHSEKTASMKIYPDSRGFYCFGCQTGGDVIQLVQHLFGLKPIDAAKKLDADFAVGAFDKHNVTPNMEIMRRQAQRRQAEEQKAILLNNISLELRSIYARKKPTTHEEAQAQAQRLAYADWLEDLREEVLHERIADIDSASYGRLGSL